MNTIRALGLGLMLSLGAALNAPAALAWGSDGHAAVGALADRLIEGSRAQREVEALLLVGESLESTANWLDCVKGTLCGVQTPEMLEYTLANPKHGQYHYTDIPFQKTHYRENAIGSAKNDIVHTLKQAINVLQGRDDDKYEGNDNDNGNDTQNPHHFTARQALLLIAHLVGDIHQPLHVGAAYVDRNGNFAMPLVPSDIDGVTLFDTRGGNNFLLDEAKLSSASARLIPPRRAAAIAIASIAARPAKRNFHAYWDVDVVDYALRRAHAVTPRQFANQAAANLPALPQTYPGQGSDPATWPGQWADDGLRGAKLAYAGVRPGRHGAQLGRSGEVIDVWTLSLTPDYPLTSARLAHQQLVKAGYRLAALLQAIWP